MRLAQVLLLILVWLHVAPVHPDQIVGKVVAVHDGDTLTVLDGTKAQHNIRLSGIDASELGQPFGNTSRTNLARYAFQRGVVADWPERDRYGPLVCTVAVDGCDVSPEQLRNCMAGHFKRYEHEQPPWAWRAEQRNR